MAKHGGPLRGPTALHGLTHRGARRSQGTTDKVGAGCKQISWSSSGGSVPRSAPYIERCRAESDRAATYNVRPVSVGLTLSITTKEELVARYIRDAIVAGRLAPGERIRQQVLASELGISPTPVREALRGLVTEGWLELVPHVGVSVAAYSNEGIDETYRIRELLEGQLGAEAATRITPEQIRHLRDLNGVLEQVLKDNDAGAWREANFKFHGVIWSAASWPVANGILNALWVKVPWAAMTVPGRESRTIKEHRRIITALASGDSERTREAVAAHVRSGRADWLAALELTGSSRTSSLG